MIKTFAYCMIALILLQGGSASSQDSHHPFTNRWTIDGPIFGAALAVAISASTFDDNLTTLSLPEIQSLNKNDINPVDRITAGWYSKDQSAASDVLVGCSILSPFLFVFDPAIRSDITIVSSMYLETVLFATFMPSYGKGLVKRVRPYAYGSSAPLARKQDIESVRSFYSGHATWAFATSIFFASVYTEYHPDSDERPYIWGGAIGLASAVSLLRVTSGAHFLSDIAVGAAVGSSIGYLIPYLHRTENSSVTFHPIFTPDFTGASFTVHLK